MDAERRIGVNRDGFTVFEAANGGRVAVRGDDVRYEHQSRAPGYYLDDAGRPNFYFRGENPNLILQCCIAIAVAIKDGEAFSGVKLEQLYRDIISPEDRRSYSLSFVAGLLEKALRANGAADAIPKLHGWTREITEPRQPDEDEPDPVIFFDIEGVIASRRLWPLDQQSRIAPDCVARIARLAERLTAKLVLTSNWRQQWPGGPDAMLNELTEVGLSADLWHRDWMLPILDGRTKWDELHAWAEARGEFYGLIIDAHDEYTGPLEVAGYYVDPADGFGVRDYDTLLQRLGFEDGGMDAPPPPTGLGFRSGAAWPGARSQPQPAAEPQLDPVRR